MHKAVNLNYIILNHENILEDFTEWQIENKATNNFIDFAEQTTDAKEIPKYASLLHKEYIIIENVLIWKDHYDESNWLKWRKNYSPIQTANVINHVHVDMMMPIQISDPKFLRLSAEIITYYWNIFLKASFPTIKAINQFDGDKIFLEQS
jgi:hypothetical protein